MVGFIFKEFPQGYRNIQLFLKTWEKSHLDTPHGM